MRYLWTFFINLIAVSTRDLPGKPYSRDISESRPHIAKIAAKKAELAHGLRGLYTAAQGINLVADLWKAESSVVNVRPEIVVMHVGSNDLAPIVDSHAATALTERVIDFGLKLHAELGVQIAIFNSAVPRNSQNMTTNHLRGFYRIKINN